MGTKRAFKRFRANRKEYAWCTTLYESTLITLVTADDDLVTPSEWERNAASFQKGAVLERIRGWLAISPSVTTTVGGCHLAMWYQDVNDPTLDPTNVANYTTEDLLWSGGTCAGSATGTGLGFPPTYFDLDVKAKRKLNSSNGVRLSYGSLNATAEFRMWGLVRALVSIP